MKRRIFKPIIILALVAVLSGVVMLLWNAIIPIVIGWGAVSYLQAAGLFVLCRLLFTGISPMQRHSRSAKFRAELRERVEGMSHSERRDYIKDYMRGEGQ